MASVIDDDVDGTAGQLQSASAGPAPRITIRYNDPGSLESVIRFRLMTRERVHYGSNNRLHYYDAAYLGQRRQFVLLS